MTKPSLPQGTRDFGPETVRKRNYIFQTIRSVFELYGFEPLETPAMENLETLMGKYGDEGDKLIFKILNNGLNDPKNADKAKTGFEHALQGKNDKNLTERALRYDLTIPFARYVAMNHGQLNYPFKRYQIQPVWRADRPQKGRYREFFQCDADIVGTYSLLSEVELAGIYAAVFQKLKLPVEIKINNRKILAALAEMSGGSDKMTAITIAIDKLDKIGMDKVKEELTRSGLNTQQVRLIETYLSIDGSNDEKIAAVNSLLGKTSAGKKGIEELEFLLAHTGGSNEVKIDLTLARGLNYYTGIIFEVKAQQVQMGSIGGGGRYDDLTGLMGVPGIPGVGISFGVDRIYDVLDELSLFPETVQAGTRVLFFNLGENESKSAFQYLQQLRTRGIAAEIYYESVKFDKQFKYAEKKHIPFAAIIGEKEISSGTVVVKDLRNGEQSTLPMAEFLSMDFS
jgi:histidyl-tRNA synthetase